MDSQNFALFVLSHIHAQDVFPAIHTNPYSYTQPASQYTLHCVHGNDCIQEHDRVNLIQRAFLPFFYDREYLVCDAAYGSVRDADAVKIPHVTPDVFVVIPFAYMEMIFSSMSSMTVF